MSEPKEKSEQVDPVDLKALQVKLEAALARMALMESQVEQAFDNSMMQESSAEDEIPTWIPGGGGGGGGLEGFLIFRGNTLLGSISIVTAVTGWDPAAVAPDNPDNWSLQFAVSRSALVAFGTTAPVGTYDTDLFDGDASAVPVEAQTFYRIPMRRGGTWICRGGVYRENIFCAGGKGPIVELLRIG